ncbi:MAG TPA: lysylphosphatidylglycerol synthase transmembrane domain-containing protein [Pseudonocardiaceae bacterium]|nr:lysylphosphatidylglycerol synthase transmembrane domain-containing protein [Pseudonocardiaceae bacterium]
MALTGQGWRRAAVAVVGLAAAGLAVRVLFDSSDELLTAADTLTSVRVWWVVVAVVVELVSYAARGAAGAVVLRRGGAVVGPMTLAAGTLAGDAAAYCLPFGFAASGVVMVGVLRRRQVGPVLAGWMFAVCSLFYVASITALTIVAVQIPGPDNPISGLQTISIVLLGVLALIGAGYALLRRPAVRLRLAAALPSVRVPLARWRRRESDDRSGSHSSALRARLRPYVLTVREGLRAWARQLRTVRLTPVAGVAVFLLMTVSWLTDVAVLALAFVALHSTPPWTGLLLAYCAGQIAASMPVTPGGIGVVEGSITLALVAFGGAETITLAAVLLYRLIAYWGCIPAGGLAWLVLRGTSRSPVMQAVVSHPEPVVTEVAEVESTS